MTPTETAAAPGVLAELRAPVRRLAREVARHLVAKLDAWQSQVKGEAEPRDPADRAVVAGLHGLATGKENPARAALRAAWGGSDVRTRAAMVGLLVLLVVTAPVLLLVLLLLGAVLAVVMWARRPQVST